MCPWISSKSKYALCLRCSSRLVVPSVAERTDYCLNAYWFCPIFFNAEYSGNSIAPGEFIDDIA